VHSIRGERRSILVGASTAMPTYPDGNVGPCFAKITATNGGHRVVTISTLAFDLPTGRRLFSRADGIPGMPNTPLPASLSDGQSAHLFVAYKDIGEALVGRGQTAKTNLIPICEDSLGGIYKGAAWAVDPQEFCGM
jgi:hypothetical protein